MSENNNPLFGDSVISSSDDLDRDFDLDANGMEIDPDNESILDLNSADDNPIEEENLYRNIPLDEEHIFKTEPLENSKPDSETEPTRVAPKITENQTEKVTEAAPVKPTKVAPAKSTKTNRARRNKANRAKTAKKTRAEESVNKLFTTQPINSPHATDKSSESKEVKPKKKVSKVALVLGLLVLIVAFGFGGYGLAYLISDFFPNQGQTTPVDTKEKETVVEDEPVNDRKSSNPNPSTQTPQQTPQAQPVEEQPQEETQPVPEEPTTTPSQDFTIVEPPEGSEPMDYDLEPEEEYIKDYGEPDYQNSPYAPQDDTTGTEGTGQENDSSTQPIE